MCVAVHEDRRVVVVAAHPAAGARLGLGAALDPLHGRGEGPDHEEPELRPRRWLLGIKIIQAKLLRRLKVVVREALVGTEG